MRAWIFVWGMASTLMLGFWWGSEWTVRKYEALHQEVARNDEEHKLKTLREQVIPAAIKEDLPEEVITALQESADELEEYIKEHHKPKEKVQ